MQKKFNSYQQEECVRVSGNVTLTFENVELYSDNSLVDIYKRLTSCDRACQSCGVKPPHLLPRWEKCMFWRNP